MKAFFNGFGCGLVVHHFFQLVKLVLVSLDVALSPIFGLINRLLTWKILGNLFNNLRPPFVKLLLHHACHLSQSLVHLLLNELIVDGSLRHSLVVRVDALLLHILSEPISG